MEMHGVVSSFEICGDAWSCEDLYGVAWSCVEL